MSVIRIAAFEQLGSCLAANIPELVGKICFSPAEPNHRLGSESLGINPLRFRYTANQPKVIAEPDYATQIEMVGQHTVDVEMRLNAPTNRRRAILEDKVLHVFLSQELSPGVISLALSSYWDATCTFELTSEEWEGERVFDKKWYSTISITASLPALVTRGDAYTIEQLRLGIAPDDGTFENTYTATTFNTDEDIEVINISDDGTYSVL